MPSSSKLTVRLRMYDLDEVMEAVHQLEKGITAAVTLGRSLILQQVCGWPLISDLRSDLVVVAVPKYNVWGCQGHLYTSVIVVGVRLHDYIARFFASTSLDRIGVQETGVECGFLATQKSPKAL